MILVKGKITIMGAGADAATRQADERGIDIVMPMHNLIEYVDNYAKISGSLWQYYRDEPNDNLADSESFKSKIKITGKTPNNNIENMLK